MKNYIQIDGQWWYTNPKRGNRMRVCPQKCSQCKKVFINRHKQKCCSKACTGVSKRGNRIGPRPCAFCEKPFVPHNKGNRQKCCSQQCAWNMHSAQLKGRWTGDKNPRWNGGRKHMKTGYVLSYVPGERHKLEHRLVMEGMIGRVLLKGEEVHHKNGIRNDNRPENLELWAKRQPGGQRVADLIEFARWVLATYGPLEATLT